MKAADYTYFEGLTFRNTDFAIWAGTQFIAGSKGLTVKRSGSRTSASGIFTNYSGSSNFYIADNYFIGRDDPDHVIGWSGNFWAQFDGVDGQKFPPVMASYVAVKVYGPGHVVAYNYVANFHDGIDVETYGNPDGSAAVDGPKYPTKEFCDRRPVSIDFYNNYMTNFHDNPFETDGSMHNIRVMRNMMINSASHAFCNQPALGGPVYWIRNIAYHLPGGSTTADRRLGGRAVLQQHDPVGDAGQGPSNVHWRNNLFLGENSAPAIFSVNTYTELHLVGLQRIPAESRAPCSFAVELAAVGDSAGGLQPPARGPPAARAPVVAAQGPSRERGARVAPVRDAGGVQPGDTPGPAQRAGRLRRVRECAEARRAGSRRFRRSTRRKRSTSG